MEPKTNNNKSKGGSDDTAAVTVLLVNPPHCVEQRDGTVHVCGIQESTGKIESCFGGRDDNHCSNARDAAAATDAVNHRSEAPTTANSQTEFELKQRVTSLLDTDECTDEDHHGYSYEFSGSMEQRQRQHPGSSGRSSNTRSNDGNDSGNDDDDDDDDDDDEVGELVSTFQLHQAFGAQHDSSSLPAINQQPAVFMLGKRYHAVHEEDQRRDYESSLFWFTYRNDFPSIEPYKITSDAGFGCMLRSAQMMLAQAFRTHFHLSSSWKPPQQISKCRQDPFLQKLLTWFADYPGNDCSYSVHNMIAAGLQYEILPGEWYGPGTSCFVLRDLVRMHSKLFPRQSLFRVHVASESTVYRDVVFDLMTTENHRRRAQEQSDECNGSGSDVLETARLAHPLEEAMPTTQTQASPKHHELEWDTGLLLLIPLRLGLDKFNPKYKHALANTFAIPQSVGVLGGRPRSARWFYASATHDDGKVYGLDPHTVQPAPRKSHTNKIDLSNEYIRSVFTSNSRTYPILQMDPSLALGFYCRNRTEFMDLEAHFSSSNELFTFADSKPVYDGSATAMMMMPDGDFDDDGNGDDNNAGNDDDDDDDEYVLL